MKTAMILALMLVLTSTACAMGGPGSVVVDIVGSKTENTKVTSGGGPVVLEFVGSVSNNTTISSPQIKIKKIKKDEKGCGYGYYPCVTCIDKPETKTVKYPWESMHLGVDAWYGTYWYTNINMPKWPVV